MALQDYSLPFSSYAPHPSVPGAYNFQPANGGNPMLFADDDGSMRRAIDSMPDTRLASNADVGAQSMGAVFGGGAMPQMPKSPPGPPAPQYASDVGNAAIGSVFGGGGMPQPINQPPAPAAPQAPTPLPGAEVAGQEGGGNTAGPVRNVVPAQASTQPQQAPQGGNAPDLNQVMGMTKMVHTPAGWRPSSQSVETKGGVQDPAMQKAMLENYAFQSKAAEDRAEAEKLQAAGVYAQSQIAANEAGKEADARAQKERELLTAQQTASDEYSRIMGVKQNELADASKREVDQYRMYKGNAGAAIGAALAAGLGAFGASIGHTPNFALDFIQRSIDRDVDAQRDEINRGVAAKQNDIARIRDQYNVSTPIAEKLLAINLTEKAQALARKQAAMAGGQAAAEKLISIDQGLADYRGKLLQDMQHTLYGDATTKVDEKYSMGGDSPQLTEEAKRLLLGSKTYGEISKGLGTGAAGEFEAAHEGRTAAQVDKGAGGGKESPRISMKRAVNESALEDLPALEKADKGGTFIPGVIDQLKSDERKNTEAAAAALVSKLTDAAGDPATEAVRHDMYSRLTASDPEVRAKTRAALLGGTKTYGEALGRASERSRGVGDMNISEGEK